MSNHHLTLAEPWFLLLLVLLPVVWWIGAKSLGGLGPVRRWVVLALRTAVVVLMVLAIAGARWVRSSDRVTVFYLVDRSLSIPTDLREAMVDYVARSIAEHRRGKDRAGVIVFGRDAAVEVPPLSDESLDGLAELTDAGVAAEGALLLLSSWRALSIRSTRMWPQR